LEKTKGGIEMKYKNWVNLNEAGKKELGHIFDDGMINCMIPIGATPTILQGKEGVHKVWKIDIKYLTSEQFEKCLDYISEKRNGDKEIIRDDWTNLGFIPLQDKYVSGFGTTKTIQERVLKKMEIPKTKSCKEYECKIISLTEQLKAKEIFDDTEWESYKKFNLIPFRDRLKKKHGVK